MDVDAFIPGLAEGRGLEDDDAPLPQRDAASAGAATDFLAGLVTHDNSMIALIDLPGLLAIDNTGDAPLPSGATAGH